MVGRSVTLGEQRIPPEEGSLLERLRALKPPTTAAIYRAGIKIMTGVFDARRSGGTRTSGTTWTAEGRDVAAYLVDSSVPLGLTVDRETSFLDLVTSVVRPWGLQVTTDATAARQILTGMTRSESRARLARERAIDRGIARDAYTEETDRRVERYIARGVGPDGRPLPASERGTVPVDLASAGIMPPLTLLPGTPGYGSALELLTPGELATMRSRRRYAAGLSPRDVETITVRQARPQPGETAWAYLQRHAQRLGLLLWVSPDGLIVVSSPNYGAEPRHRIVRRAGDQRSNVIEAVSTYDASGRYSKTLVYGRTGGNDATRSRFRGAAVDDSMPWPRLKIIHDGGIRSQDEADRRAKREAKTAAMRAEVHSYEVVGHEQNGLLWAPDTMIDVVDDVEGLDGTFWCFRRTLLTGPSGNTTKVYLLPPGAFST
jgi:prophage tail gpP-like protein